METHVIRVTMKIVRRQTTTPQEGYKTQIHMIFHQHLEANKRERSSSKREGTEIRNP